MKDESTDAALREQLIQAFFAAFQSEAASALVHQKAITRDDCSSLVSSFARIAADKYLALRDAARREQTKRDASELEPTVYALARDMARRGLFVRDDFGAPNIHAIKELAAGIAAALLRDPTARLGG